MVMQHSIVLENTSTFAEQVFSEVSGIVGTDSKSEVSGNGGGEGQPLGAPSTVGREEGLTPLLDTLLHKTTKDLGGRKLLFRRSTGKLFSRATIGMMVPGDFYFITFTSSPKSPDLKGSWDRLRKWFHYRYPPMTWLYVMTNEGYGVIHMIVRLPKGHDRIEHSVMDGYWLSIHLAHCLIKKVFNPKGLSNYISDQRKRKGMSVEISSQEQITAWRMSKGWVPKAFMLSFGRFWALSSQLPPAVRINVVNQWILEVLSDYSLVNSVPRINSKGVLNYV